MMRLLIAVILATALTVPLADAGSPTRVTAPVEFKVKAGRIGKLTAEFDGGKPVRWVNLHDNLDLIPIESGRIAIVASPVAGTYKVAAYSADAAGNPTEPTYCTVIVEGDTPPPVPPPPGPVPPPNPPPGPVVDGLLDAVKPIYGADVWEGKRAAANAMAVVFTLGASMAADAKYTTAGELSNAVQKAASASVPLPGLKAVRERIGEELQKTLGTNPDEKLSPELRAKYKQQYRRVADVYAALGELPVAMAAPVIQQHVIPFYHYQVSPNVCTDCSRLGR